MVMMIYIYSIPDIKYTLFNNNNNNNNNICEYICVGVFLGIHKSVIFSVVRAQILRKYDTTHEIVVLIVAIVFYDIDASILEGENNANYHFIFISLYRKF